MKPFWKDWGITPRVILIAVLPALLMFVSVVVHSYFSRATEVEEELAERGRLVASLLAEGSELDVVTGNLGYLQETINRLIHVDKSIRSIEILNANDQSLLRITDNLPPEPNSRELSAPIRRELVAVNVFADPNKPHVSPLRSLPAARSAETIGQVRVTATASPMLAKQRQRMLVGSLIAAVALLLTLLLGLGLALSLTRPLASMIGAVRRIRRGDYAVDMSASASGELGELQTSIREMAVSLNQLTSDLENKVLARTRDLEAARDETLKSNAEKMRLIQKVTAAIEEERKTIAREIHDHLNAELIAARLEAQRILTLSANGSASGEIEDKARSIVQLTSNLYKLGRQIVARLRPEILDALGLGGAVEEMIRHYDALHSGCRFSFEELGDLSGLSDELAIAAYRVTQEALSNVVKHAHAKSAAVSLQLSEKERILRIRITDDGIGFDPATSDPGLGLIGMRERAHGLGGRISIDTARGAGTAIIIEFPVHEDRT
jgi:two-component system, NarL family, sensor histidine kinase UhpB